MVRSSVKRTSFHRPARRARTPIGRSTVRSAMRAASETKNRVTTYNGTTVDSTTGHFTDFTLFAAGPDYDQRNGNRVYVKSVHVHGIFKCAATDKNNIMRFQAGIAKGTPLTTGALSMSSGTQYRTSWVVKDFILSSAVTDDASGVVGVPVNFKIKVNREVWWTDETTTAPIRNQVWMHLISDSVAATHPTFTGHAVTWFKDI